MKQIKNQTLTGERALFMTKDAKVTSCIFEDGESPLKESCGIEMEQCTFRWKYPLWYCRDVKVQSTLWEETARSGIWYTHNIELSDCTVNAPKQFRRASGIRLEKCSFPYALETMWMCRDITMRDCHIVGDYFGLNCENVTLENVVIDGNYCFDGGRNIEAHHCTFHSKDSFWNCENVTIYDSVIVGEYLGWNSRNVRFVRCRMESNQGFCYMEDVVLEDCVLENTDLAFEYSTVDATVHSRISSVKNPSGGRIASLGIDELILDENTKAPHESTVYIQREERK